MNTFIYKGLKKTGSYLYILEKDDFSSIPETLLTILGQLEFVMELEIVSSTKLAQADASKVILSLKEESFYLQMPEQTLLNPLSYSISG